MSSTELLGRQDECQILDRVLGTAQAGHGGAMVICGDPGIGKSTLAAYAIDAATGFQVLHVVGNEAERELPYAAAQQLCALTEPAFHELPERHQDALWRRIRQYCRLAARPLFVGLAFLDLLTRVASKTPILCVVDDAQWLDKESAQVFAIVARRLEIEPIVSSLVLEQFRRISAVYRPCPSSVLDGRTRGFSCGRHFRVPSTKHVIERIVTETRGNPLALLELPRGLSPAELAGGFDFRASVPVAGQIEASYRRRIAKLPLSPASSPRRGR